MAVTRERFSQGLTYAEFKAQMTRNQSQFEANERALELDRGDLAAFKNLRKPLNVLVIGEDWCGDVIANLPVLGRLAQESGKLEVRVFLRDKNLDLMDQYLKEGKYRSIPVFVFLDDQFNELGRFIERPDSVTERRERRRREIYAQHPEFGSPDAPIDQLPEDVRTKLSQLIADMRQEVKPTENREVVAALRAIIEKA